MEEYVLLTVWWSWIGTNSMGEKINRPFPCFCFFTLKSSSRLSRVSPTDIRKYGIPQSNMLCLCA